MVRLLSLLFCLFAVTACAPSKPPEPEKTQLEIRQMQTRTFDTDQYKLVMKSVLNTLQDENFIVKNVAMDLGFLTATQEKDIEDSHARMWAKMQRAESARWPKHEVIEATVNVSEFGKQVRVRVNFQKKIMDNCASVISVSQLTDEKFYQNFFSKVDKGIFIQQQDI
ncbi:MAG: hypothetical protein LLF94_02420 [Chlamydiales bacterium]|nr:hypothetical protein [Chlamydiales bacterium]